MSRVLDAIRRVQITRATRRGQAGGGELPTNSAPHPAGIRALLESASLQGAVEQAFPEGRPNLSIRSLGRACYKSVSKAPPWPRRLPGHSDRKSCLPTTVSSCLEARTLPVTVSQE